MAGKIVVWNTNGNEDHSQEENNYYIGRSKAGNVLGNPFTHNGKRSSLAKLSFKTRDEAIDAYEKYFDAMYGHDQEFTDIIDEIYEKYKNGNTVYLQCFCHPLRCHGDIIAAKLQSRLIKSFKKSKS